MDSCRVRDQGLCKGPQDGEDRGLQHQQHQSTRDRIPQRCPLPAGRWYGIVLYAEGERGRASAHRLQRSSCRSDRVCLEERSESLREWPPIKGAENRGSLKDETIAGKGTLVRIRNRGAKDSCASDCRKTSTSFQSGARCVKEASQIESAGLRLAGASTRCYETDGKWKARFTDSAGSSLSMAAWQCGTWGKGRRAHWTGSCSGLRGTS